ncbi:Imm32 family immunity protein [Brevundimonas sp.]|uniref:Imm32 family immunity protein n=1 Tax=Brevundimonas sp. TaxID=1871086 RepID=UPI002FC9526E
MPAATPEDQKAVSEIYDALWALVDRRTQPEQFPEFVATRHHENAVELAGNTDGLLLLAAYALRTAMAKHEGYHEHIDEVAFAKAGSVSVIISRL